MLLELPLIHARGSPEELGWQHGKQLSERIRSFVRQRSRAARAYLFERGARDEDRWIAIAAACLEAQRAWDPAGWREHHAIAAAAGVDPVELHAAANMTDIRDIATLTTPTAPDAEGCSALVLPANATATGSTIGAQTWDLNPSDLDDVVAIHRLPDDAPETWSVTVAGTPVLIGMNQHGVAVGTTNIKTRPARPGVPYCCLLLAALRERTAQAALERIATAPRAAAHTFWAVDPHDGGDLECTATTCHRRFIAQGPLWRTNHCLHPPHQTVEAEPPSTSSLARWRRIAAFLATTRPGIDDLRRLFADRCDGVDAINRYAEDGQGTSTNACVICLPHERRLHACRGSADRGRWAELSFDRSTHDER